jgi:hypothetical protein
VAGGAPLKLRWLVYLITGARAAHLGTVAAPDRDAAIAAAAAKFGVPVIRIIVVRQVANA